MIFVARRISILISVLVGLTLLTFLLANVAPGDPARLAAGPHATEEQVEALRKEFDLDKHVLVQYWNYLRRLVRGDWGTSIRTYRPVRDDLIRAFPATLEVVLAALLLAVVLGVPLGIAAAIRQRGFLDSVVTVLSMVSIAAPRFWLALLLQLGFALWLSVLPLGGRLHVSVSPPQFRTGFLVIDSVLAGNWTAFGSYLSHLILPSVALCLAPMATMARITRATLIEVMNQDYVQLARASGIPEVLVVGKYMFRNALIAPISIAGLYFGWLLGGSFLIEAVFDWPGIGLYGVEAAINLDLQAMVGVTLLIGASIVVVNTLVDLLYALVDPRIRLGKA